MYIFYIDDSRDQGHTAFAALGIPMKQWKPTFYRIVQFRSDLRREKGIFTNVEFHATDFLGGRGRIGTRTVRRDERSEIFKQTLELVAQIPGAKLLCACDSSKREYRLFERLLNRISTCMRKAGGTAIVVCDEGKEIAYTRLARRLGKINHIPSRFGCWPDGSSTQNIPTDHIIEDLVFKSSTDSHFVQMADFCAYALMRMEKPLQSKSRYGLDQAFTTLRPLCVPDAFAKDPRRLGIVRLA
jgi:hypothetical protein